MTDEAMPKVVAYPKCSECSAPYVLRHCFRFGGAALTNEWLWQRDCKHKTAEAIVVDAQSESADA